MQSYIINDSSRNYPLRDNPSSLSTPEILQMQTKGYLLKSNLFSPEEMGNFSDALAQVIDQEKDLEDRMYENHKGSIYLRWLLTKDRRFFPLNQNKDIISIGRTFLGPQIKIDDADARVSFAGHEDGIGWHIHLRSIPLPTPAFFCYPHAIHFLLYLDDISPNEGGLCVLPGSHQNLALQIPKDSYDDFKEQEVLYPKKGDVVLIHANLWHRALFSTPFSKERRLLISTLSPSWLRDEYNVGKAGPIDWRAEYRALAKTPEDHELLGDFSWC